MVLFAYFGDGDAITGSIEKVSTSNEHTEEYKGDEMTKEDKAEGFRRGRNRKRERNEVKSREEEELRHLPEEEASLYELIRLQTERDEAYRPLKNLFRVFLFYVILNVLGHQATPPRQNIKEAVQE
ncbi:uncharacterized protein OCT59_002623 [Rhizophagus irregularis]|uniref:Uncharacterized protein n=1 Tax=Rhizophagus irregularis TaxID=588596 RepID=A0A916EG24_9GLOM|nr:hypothetical protein OCT59_002623 [Rhizophagus irregularis]CAB5384894.1 unnamed protein product [Rhizophagus irregularis]